MTTRFLFLMALVARPLLAQAALPSYCRGGPADNTAIKITGTLPYLVDALSPLVDSVLTERGFTVPDSTRGPPVWITAPRYTWTFGSEHESWHGSDHPGVQVFVRLVARSDSTYFEVAARVLCFLHSHDEAAKPGSVESKVKTLAAIDVSSQLAARLTMRRH